MSLRTTMNHSLNTSTKASIAKKLIKTEYKLDILKAKLVDMDLVAAFIRSSADWYQRFVDPKDMAEHNVGTEWIQRNFFRRDFYIGYHDGKPVGTISHQSLGDFSYLGYIYLDVNQVGKGFGHQLIDHAKAISQKKQAKGMVLIAHPEATWATKAYIKYGFELISSDKDEILAWNNGALKTYYEEGFELYCYLHPTAHKS